MASSARKPGSTPGDRYTWYIDPIDGTKSFISGMPLFGTLIALADERNGDVIAGMIDMPALAERWYGTPSGTTFNEVPARVSRAVNLEDAQIYTSSPDFFSPEDWARYDALSRKAMFRRFGGDCYQYGLLASGHCDLVVESSLNSFDFMALVPVIEGAGGMICDWEGQPLTRDSDGRVIAAANADAAPSSARDPEAIIGPLAARERFRPFAASSPNGDRTSRRVPACISRCRISGSRNPSP